MHLIGKNYVTNIKQETQVKGKLKNNIIGDSLESP